MGSGSSAIVSSSPAAATTAATISAPRMPSDEASMSGNRNAPANAPSLPTPAEIPWPVVRTSTGNSSAG